MKSLKNLFTIFFSFFLIACMPSAKMGLKVGLLTDKDSIDDKSFNQNAWEGLQQAKADLKAEITYLKPGGTSQSDYLKEIGNLYDAGFKLIVTCGHMTSGPVFLAQKKYQDAKFILLDEVPALSGEPPMTNFNTVAVLFAEHQAGFIAAVAAAVEIKEGDFAFIGGMEGPTVQRFNWGFQQGIAYANTHLNSKITIKPENVIYQGTFSDIAAGQQLAALLYNRGVKVIFTAAGAVGMGVINEAKAQVVKKTVWVIGVDSDQFSQGEYQRGKSVVLTSAIKDVKRAAYQMVKAEYDGRFPGGKTVVFDAGNAGIGLPKNNPNLSQKTIDQVVEVFEKLKSGEIQVSAEKGNLIK